MHRPTLCALFLLATASLAAGCLSPEPAGLAPAAPANTVVRFDFFYRPLPEIPLPNDLATRYDPDSPTGLRLNTSMIAPTEHERKLRRQVDELDGWGVLQHITVPFTGPLDVESILAGHRDADYDPSNDVIYLIDVDPDSPERGQLVHLDLGNGNYPVILENQNYYANDPRDWNLSLLFEEADEDLDGDGVLDLGGDRNGDGDLDDPDEWPEDSDGDGVLDRPNYLPGHPPAREDLAGRADALMTFYEAQTHTLIARPMRALRERTTYAVVITKRLKDRHGDPVGSPFPSINHAAQTAALADLPELLPAGLTLSDVAFAYAYTTQSIDSHWIAVRDGLYGHGVQGHIGRDFPPVIDRLAVMRDPESDAWRDVVHKYVVYFENIADILPLVGSELLGVDASSAMYRQLSDALGYVDYLAAGSFVSPQLYPREDTQGRRLHLGDQVWPADLDRVPVPPPRPESVYFTLYMPRQETWQRPGGHVPVMLFSHGYTSNRLEAMIWAGFLARHGVATFAMECPSHGVELKPEERAQYEGMLAALGLDSFVKEALKDRAIDWDGDGVSDSAPDFWTSYLFHTRDMVRQCTVDYMQAIRTLRTFDGARRWAFDVDGDGQPDLAGDFDGDGVVDIGASSLIGMNGSSLGGIMSTMLGSLEPEMTTVSPQCGGGGLTDVGNRSLQGGVREAVQLRLMAPLYVGTLGTPGTGGDDGAPMRIDTIVPDLNRDRTVHLGDVTGVQPGDSVVVINDVNGERGCATVSRQGRFRLSVASDIGDATRLVFYRGPALAAGEHCQVRPGAVARLTFDTFGVDVAYQDKTFAAGAPLVAIEEGTALKRGTPAFRRLLSLAQLAVDPGDPGAVVKHLSAEPLHYPGTGQTTGTHALIITTVGDMNVPASGGITAGRAAGFIDYLTPDPRYGVPVNQQLLDTYTAEAVHKIGRYRDKDGEPVHIDVDDYADGDDIFSWRQVPRLDPPLRLVAQDALGGLSGAVFPYVKADGKHDLPLPGDFTDQAIALCQRDCDADPALDCATCRAAVTFDIGLYFYNIIARYLTSSGQTLDWRRCNAFGDCDDLPPAPPARKLADLL